MEHYEGPLFEQRKAVETAVFMSRIAETGHRYEDMCEFIIEMFRKKDVQKVKLKGSSKL